MSRRGLPSPWLGSLGPRRVHMRHRIPRWRPLPSPPTSCATARVALGSVQRYFAPSCAKALLFSRACWRRRAPGFWVVGVGGDDARRPGRCAHPHARLPRLARRRQRAPGAATGGSCRWRWSATGAGLPRCDAGRRRSARPSWPASVFTRSAGSRRAGMPVLLWALKLEPERARSSALASALASALPSALASALSSRAKSDGAVTPAGGPAAQRRPARLAPGARTSTPMMSPPVWASMGTPASATDISPNAAEISIAAS